MPIAIYIYIYIIRVDRRWTASSLAWSLLDKFLPFGSPHA